MGTLGGIALIAIIMIVAGAIAYIGDRVGHQVGRKRLTLFNLRPKYTSTIVAVATGMMTAFVATLIVLLTSNYARAAFFHLQEINNRVNELQAQADALNKHVRESNVIINRGDLLYDRYLVITPSMSGGARRKALTAYFDALVLALDRHYVPLGLKPYPLTSSDKAVQKKLEPFLADQRLQGFLLRGPVIVLAVADQNLFVNDPLHFEFQPYPDQLIFPAHRALASIEVDGGSQLVPRAAYSQLATAVQDAAISLGMPDAFDRALSALTPEQVSHTQDRIRRGRGRFYIIARSTIDVYPHTGGIPIEFQLSRTPK